MDQNKRQKEKNEYIGTVLPYALLDRFEAPVCDIQQAPQDQEILPSGERKDFRVFQ